MIPEPTLSRIERRKLRASPERQKAVARELGVSVDELFVPIKLSPRDEAILADYARLRSSVKVAQKRRVQKKTVLSVLARAGIETRDRSREREDRLERVAELDAEDVPRKTMAKQLGISQSQLQADLRDLDRPKRPPRRKHPKPEPRECAHPECSVIFRPTGSQVAEGWGSYCSTHCAQTSPSVVALRREVAKVGHKKAKAERERDGRLTLREASKRLTKDGIGENTLGRYAGLGLLAVEWRQIGNERVGLLTPEELARFRREDFPDLVERFAGEASTIFPFRPPAVRQKWGRYRGGRGGYLGAAAGIEHGRAKGGRHAVATGAQQQEMLRLDGEGLSSRKVAERVFGDERYYKRVQRFLSR